MYPRLFITTSAPSYPRRRYVHITRSQISAVKHSTFEITVFIGMLVACEHCSRRKQPRENISDSVVKSYQMYSRKTLSVLHSAFISFFPVFMFHLFLGFGIYKCCCSLVRDIFAYYYGTDYCKHPYCLFCVCLSVNTTLARKALSKRCPISVKFFAVFLGTMV